MPERYLTIQSCRELMDDHPLVHQDLNHLIRFSIQEKKTSFLIEKFSSEFERLSEVELIKGEFEKFFVLNYSALPVTYILLEIAQEMMKQQVPIDPVPALRFANQFAELIRQPKPRTFWYQDLERCLEAYTLIWLHQAHNIDITAFYDSLTEEMKDANPDLRSIEMTYSKVFPYLGDEVDRLFETIISMYENPNSKDSAFQAVRDLCEIDPQKGAVLYEFAKSHGGLKYEGLLTHFLKGLYLSDQSRWVNEVIQIHERAPMEGILTISWLDYDNEKDISAIFDFVRKQIESRIEYIRILPALYTRLIENPHTPDNIKDECFRLIDQLASQEDIQLRSDLVWRTGMIKGHDKEKMELFPRFMAWGQPHFINNYFHQFDSPAPLFELIRQAFLEHGMSVNLKLFEHAISAQFMLHKEQFSRELLDFLSNDLAIIRFAGFRIMMSRYGGSYEVDFLDLDEKGQLRVIESLLPTPTSIEELLPMILKLRNSPFANVRRKLELELVTLIAAYDHHVIDMAKEHLDESQESDKKLLDNLSEAYQIFKKDTDARFLIKELDPWENELRSIELYYQLEHENQSEMMEKMNKQSFFAQMAKNITIIRGSGFNSEINTKISMLGEVGTSRLIDRRHTINPDSYEWNFRMNAMTKNYNDEDIQ